MAYSATTKGRDAGLTSMPPVVVRQEDPPTSPTARAGFRFNLDWDITSPGVDLDVPPPSEVAPPRSLATDASPPEATRAPEYSEPVAIMPLEQSDAPATLHGAPQMASTSKVVLMAVLMALLGALLGGMYLWLA